MDGIGSFLRAAVRQNQKRQNQKRQNRKRQDIRREVGKDAIGAITPNAKEREPIVPQTMQEVANYIRHFTKPSFYQSVP